MDYETTATKLIEINKRCTETFSKERQYDYGLRAVIKSIRIGQKQYEAAPNAVILNYLLSMKTRLSTSDIEKFEKLVSEFLPDQTFDWTSARPLSVYEESLTAKGLSNSMASKVRDTEEMIKRRTGTIILGAEGIGKSTLI